MTRSLRIGGFLICAALLGVQSFAAKAEAQAPVHTLRLEGGAAFMLGSPQKDDFDIGGGGHAGYELRFVPAFGLELSHASYFFPTKFTSDKEYGDYHAPGLGFRLHPFPNSDVVDVWLGATGTAVFTGEEIRAGLHAGLGFEFVLSSVVRLGPYARYHHVFQPNSDSLGPPDAKFISAGLSLALTFGGREEHVSGDRDQDGILDDQDRCPGDPEDRDGHEDNDGCPDVDNDGDGVPDAQDRCPTEAEDRDGQNDSDGCPDGDNDNDGIPDDQDRCPADAEDRDGYEDTDGCPDTDNDNDGIPDEQDRCPTEAEDRDGFSDEDGCIDPDNDGDGVPDTADECPTAPGKAENRGCPVAVRMEGTQIKILQRIEFASNKAKLRPSAFPILDEVKAVMEANPQIRKVRVEGHTDDRGRDEKNERLSQLRAEAVVQWLVEHGIAVDRLEARGIGEARPIADNSTNAGRQENRRVEFHIVETTQPTSSAAPSPAAAPAQAAPAQTTASPPQQNTPAAPAPRRSAPAERPAR